MNELKHRYTALRHQAIELMHSGNVNGYLAKLVALHDVRIQILQVSVR